MTRAQSGRKAQANGDGFERALDRMHAIYTQRTPSAYVVRLGPPTRPVGHGEALRFINTSKGPPDYLAVHGFYTYLFEAKSTEGDAMSYGMIKPHQAQQLTAAERAGCYVISGVVAQIGRVGAWWLPWRSLGPLWWRWNAVAVAKRGEGSITPDDADRIGRRCVGLDWLTAAGAAYLEGK